MYLSDEEVKEKKNPSSFFQSPATRVPLWTVPFHEREQEGIVVQKSPSGTAARESGLSLEVSLTQFTV